jgi:hypothetical protein
VVKEPEVSAGIDLAFARRAWDPAPRHGPADLRWQVGMHTARPLSRARKSSPQQWAWFTNFEDPFFLPPSTAADP